jgi:REP element-mobilizing transposase RayT
MQEIGWSRALALLFSRDSLRALAAEVLMTISHRGWTGHDTYFVTASAADKKSLLQSGRMADLFLELLRHYRGQHKYLLHEFVVMPNHFHLLLTPEVTLERALQLIKGTRHPAKR